MSEAFHLAAGLGEQLPAALGFEMWGWLHMGKGAATGSRLGRSLTLDLSGSEILL